MVGDINSAGFLVAQNATVTLIDADSFQVGPHRCRVGMVEYTPPELQGVPFGTVDRTPDHDAFGLAVMLFQVLALGRHPYAGVVRGRAVALDQAIVQGRFAYSTLRAVNAAPPPGSLHLEDLSRTIRLLFERAFAIRLGPRPTAAEWVPTLAQLATGLQPCPRMSNHHIAVASVPCPWCRIERATKRPIFLGGVIVGGLDRAVPPSKLREQATSAIQEAKRHAGDMVDPMWSRADVRPSKAARNILENQGGKAGQRPSGVRVLELALGGGRKVIDSYQIASLTAKRALEGWRTRLGIWEIAKLTDEIRSHVEQIDRMQTSRASIVAQATARIDAAKVTEIMSRERIDTARIAGIAAALRAHLTRNGIVTAADVSRPALAAIGGIGEARVVALLFWREAVAVKAEAQIRSASPTSPTIPAEAAVDRHIQQKEHCVQALIADLDTRVSRVRRAVWLIDRTVEEALIARDQAAVDLSYLGLAEFARRNASPIKVPSPPLAKLKRKSGAKSSARSCPRCGASMVKRWGQAVSGNAAVFLGCSAYPKCNGIGTIRKKGTP